MLGGGGMADIVAQQEQLPFPPPGSEGETPDDGSGVHAVDVTRGWKSYLQTRDASGTLVKEVVAEDRRPWR